ncbi:peptidyl-prolyl cis-trans isomerase CYP23-like isoform X1 [Apium graveolens]|uniref:peptidyl-prolyl cis-trans isomerase CYP23-like isoform X1 n=1 Tax=Apium graveolens TaxID=4045 RepID=UPI003D7A8176
MQGENCNGVLSILMILTFSNFLCTALGQSPQLGSARVVFQTNYGDIEFGFYPSVAPKTVEHIYKLVRLGCYNTNHFFRVDHGFVAQVADVGNGRSAPMNEVQKEEAYKTVVGEFSSVKHVRGILSMGRHSDPNSGGSSFSILLGDAPHLDGQYAIFGMVTKGDETLKKFEQLPTRREGIFVMPTERISILSSYYYDSEMETCEQDKSLLRRRLEASAFEIERQRMKCFP